MATIGTGRANGSGSLLHAAGIGYGASLALDLKVIVRLLDSPGRKEIDDPDELFPAIIEAWTNSGYKLPAGDIHWSVNSKIPPRQGLKSSSAICVAAIKALCEATDTELEDHQIVDIATIAQLSSGVSLTGSIDDSWAAISGGWKLIDINAESASSGIIMEASGPVSEDWRVFIVLRGEREQRPELDSFSFHRQAFSQAVSALQEGQELVALTWNGRGVIGAVNDGRGRILTNDAFVNGARAAGISGSGSAIVIFAPSISEPICNRILSWYGKFDDLEIIETSIINSINTDNEE